MNNIFEVWEYILFICNKYMNGFVTPPEVSKSLNVAQDKTFNFYIKARQRGSELALNALKPFLLNSTVTSDSSGFVSFPIRYTETDGVYETINGDFTTINRVFHNELSDALRSKIYPISQFPRFMEGNTGITIYPNEIHSNVNWMYYARPNVPNIGFTISGNEVLPDPSSAVELDFDKQYWPEIILRALQDIGVNLSKEQITELGLIGSNGGTD